MGYPLTSCSPPPAPSDFLSKKCSIIKHPFFNEYDKLSLMEILNIYPRAKVPCLATPDFLD